MAKEVEDFWEKAPSTEDVSFFDMTTPSTEIEDVIEEIVKDKIIETDVTTTPEATDTNVDDVVEEVKFFEGTDDEDGEGNEITTPNPEVITKTNSKNTLEFLKEKGLVDYQLEEGTELTDELANEILEDNWEDSIDEAAGEKIKALPDFLKTLIQVALNEGDVVGTLNSLVSHFKTGISKDTDMEVEANQIMVMRHNLAGQGYDDEYIASHIEVLKDTGKLKDMSIKVKDKVLIENDKYQAEAVKKAELAKEKDKEDKRQYKLDMTTFISSKEEAKGIALNKKDKEILPAYMSDATINLADGRKITPLQRDIFALFSEENREKLVAVAKLVHSDFDLSSVAAKANSTQARTIRNQVQNNKGIIITGSSTGSSQTRSKKNLADLL